MKLKIITPVKEVINKDIESITVPSSEGEITILPRHENLFTLLAEGIVTMRTSKEEEFMAIGGGYLETDGQEVQILVSRAYNQDSINENLTEKAIQNAKTVLEQTKDQQQRIEAQSVIRRSLVDLKLLKKRRRSPSINTQISE